MKRKLSPGVARLVERIARREGIPPEVLLRRYFPEEEKNLKIDNRCLTAYDSLHARFRKSQKPRA